MHASQGVQALVKAIKYSSSRVVGTPQSFASLRSRTQALWQSFGCWSIFMNFNPSENAPLFFETAGVKFPMTSEGRLDEGCPSLAERWRIIASDPKGVAQYIDSFFRAFEEVFLGWDRGARRRTDPTCMFGPILAYFFNSNRVGVGANTVMASASPLCCSQRSSVPFSQMNQHKSQSRVS